MRLGVIIVLGFIGIIIGLHLVLPRVLSDKLIFESPLLLFILNAIFSWFIPLTVVLVASQAYLASGSPNVLLLGCGMLTMSFTVLASSWAITFSTGAAVTVHNLGVLLASLLHLGAVFVTFLRIPSESRAKRKRLNSIIAYSGVLSLIALVVIGTLRGTIPPFFVKGVGFPVYRNIILGSAISLFTLSFLFLIKVYRREKSAFLFWYSLALLLYAVGLFGVWMQRLVADPIGWTGRFAQILSGIYFLAAALIVVHTARSRRVSVGDFVTAFLRESELDFKELVEKVREAIIAVDAEERVLFWNSSAERMFGYLREQAVGRLLTDLILPSNHKDRAAEKVEDLVQTGNSPMIEGPKDVALSTKMGHRIDARITVSTRMGAKGRIATFVVRDITERKRAEEALKQRTLELQQLTETLELRVKERTADLAKSNQELQEEIARRAKAEQQLLHAQKMEAIGTLAGGIAHDFNNVLLGIIASAEICLQEVPESTPIRNKLERIIKAGVRGRDLTKQVLALSGKYASNPKIVSLKPLLQETFDFLRSTLPRTIEMQLHLEEDRDRILADVSQIQQVVINLSMNAAYAMQERHGRLEISLEGISIHQGMPLPDIDMAPGDYLVLSVRDSGVGMDEEIQKRIFEPFFTTKPLQEGTGLGLFVVYGIVKNHKGTITVSSEPGKGSLFRVFIPRADAMVTEEKEVSRATIPRGNESVLFVDDEEIIVASMRNVLEHLGYKVLALADSREALVRFREAPAQFDIAILDQTMPHMTGDALAQKMIGIRPDIPIILCSGHGHQFTAEKAREMGIHFLEKPTTMREIAEIVRIALDQRKNMVSGVRH